MRIGLNLLYLLPGVVGGTETYAAGLLHGLARVDSRNDYLIFVNAESTFWPLPETLNMHRIVCPVRAASRSRRLAYEQLTLPRLAEGHRLDLLHSLGYVAPLRSPCPDVVTIHDMNTKGHGQSMGLCKRILLSFLVRMSARRCDHVITVSDFSRQEILAHLRLPENKISVVLEAPLDAYDADETSGGTDIPDVEKPYILAFASLSPHKNITGLIHAYALLAPEIPHQLVLAGHVPTDQDIAQAISRLGLTSRVTLTGFLPGRGVQSLLANTDLFVFPSLYEGFGLPVLEAQSKGAVVACSDRGALPEVGGEGAVYFNPDSFRDMAEVMRRCLFDSDLRRHLQETGARNVSRFSWDQTARQTLAVYERITGQSTP